MNGFFNSFIGSLKKFALHILVSTLAIYISSMFFSESIQLTNKFTTSIQVAIVLSLFNAYLKPLLVSLTIPLTIFTLGFFLIVINAIVILLASHFVPNFHIAGFWTAFWFGIVLSIITSILEGFGGNFKMKVIKKDDHDKFDDYEEVD